ncbi:MAG TPA: NAD-dependent epimerase/dehydratase family protein [Methanomassiliicoccales archaeon]|jgi:GDP-L-fucose synthase
MKVFVTGGRGFIGRNLVEKLPTDMEICAPTSKELDLLDQAAVEGYINSHDFDIVIHTATWNSTANSKKDTHLVLEKNLLMFFNLTRLSDRFGKMIYLGSGAEYDRRYYLPSMKEEYFDRHIPVDQYGLSKYIMAKTIDSLDNIIDLRVFGCFGPYEDWEIRFISNAMCKALFGLPISIRKNVFFDYIWVDDLVRMIGEASRNKMKHRHYNACTGRTVDLITLARMVREISGTNLDIDVQQEGQQLEYSGDNSRIMQELKDFHFTPLNDSIGSLFRFYAQNLGMIDRNLLLVDKH